MTDQPQHPDDEVDAAVRALVERGVRKSRVSAALQDCAKAHPPPAVF